MDFRLILVFVILIFDHSISFGQLEKDPVATQILKGVSEKYRSFQSVSSQFKIEIEDLKTKTKETQTGNISIRGDKYKLILANQEVISDGKTVWTYLKEVNEVQINDPSSQSGSITPNNIFTLYEKGFGSKYTGVKTIGGKLYQFIELVPEDTKKPFFKVQIQINKSEKQITSAKIFQKNGTYLIYTVEKFKPNSITSDDIFVFDKSKFPGVEIIDLR